MLGLIDKGEDMEELDAYFRLEISTSIELDPHEPDDYMPDYLVNILASVDESGDFELAGKVRFLKTFPLDKVRCNIHDMFDAANADLAELMELFDENGDVAGMFSDVVGDVYYTHILYLYSIEMLPKYRKRGLTKAVTEKILSVFVDDPEYTLILLHACPMRNTLIWADPETERKWNQDMGYSILNQENDKAQMKLMKKYEEELGFRSAGIRNLMFRFQQVM